VLLVDGPVEEAQPQEPAKVLCGSTSTFNFEDAQSRLMCKVPPDPFEFQLPSAEELVKMMDWLAICWTIDQSSTSLPGVQRARTMEHEAHQEGVMMPSFCGAQDMGSRQMVRMVRAMFSKIILYL
jgi:hypothetical protein